MEPKHNPLEVARSNFEVTKEEVNKLRTTLTIVQPLLDKLMSSLIDEITQEKYRAILEVVDELEERHAGLVAEEQLDRFEITSILQTTHKALQEFLYLLNHAQGDLGGGLSEETSRETRAQIESIIKEIQETVIIMKKYGVEIPED